MLSNYHSTEDEVTFIVEPNFFYTDSLLNIVMHMNDQSANYSLIQDSSERRMREIDQKIILESYDEDSSFNLNGFEERDLIRLQVRRKKSERDINKVSQIMKKISSRSISKFRSKSPGLKSVNLYSLSPCKKLNILLCDDDIIVTNSAKKIIEKSLKERNVECQIDVFHSGIEALYYIYVERRNQKFYDLLIIDESMPFMRGSLVVNNIKTIIEENELKDIVMYISSSYEEVLSSCCEIIKKPITYESVLGLLKRHKFVT